MIKVTFNVDEPNTITSNGVIANVSCSGLSDGSITLNLAGGTGTLNTTWTSSVVGFVDPGTDNLINLDSGTYELNIVDANGCTYDTSFILSTPAPIFANAAKTDVSCYGFADGTIDLSTSNGNTPYQWSWTASNGFSSTDEDLVALDTGIYSVTITDFLGCTKDTSITILQPDSIDVSGTSSDILCNGDDNGNVNITVVGGNAPVNWSWTSSDPAFVDPGSNTNLLDPLDGGTYTVSIVDDLGCTKDTTFTVDEPNPIQVVAIIANVSCNGLADGSIDVTPSGGFGSYLFDWDNDGTTDNDDTEDLASLSQNNYCLTLIDQAQPSCTFDTCFSVSEPDELFIGNTIVSEIICADSLNGAIDISPVGGAGAYVFDWDNDGIGDADDNEDLNNVGGGAYAVRLEDGNSCFKDSTINITPIDPIIFNPNVTTSNCGLDNGNISVNPNGGNLPYILSWDNGGSTNTISSLFQGNYTLTLSYIGNTGFTCSVDTTFSIIDNPSAIDATFNPTDESCFGSCDGNIIATINNALAPITYNWTSSNPSFVNDGNPNQFDLCSGTYFLDMLDANNCPYKDTLTISSADEIVTTETITPVLCGGDSTGAISISVIGGSVVGDYIYEWVGQNTGFTSSSASISSLIEDNYFLTVTDDDGCVDTATYTVNENTPILITQNSNDASCNLSNGSADITVSGGVDILGYQYIWEDNSGFTISNSDNITNVSAGIYKVTVTDDVGCIDSTTISISDLSQSTITIDSIKHESCAGDQDGLISVSILAIPFPGILTWVGPAGFADPGGNNTTINNLGSGEYIATLTDGAGCILTEIIDINEAQSLTVNAIIDSLDCFGDNDGAIDLFVSGGNVAGDYIYDWDNDGIGDDDDSQDLSSLSSGVYNIIIYDDANCSLDTSFNLQSPTELTGSTSANLTDCGLSEGQAQVNVTGGTILNDYTFIWTDDTGLQIGATNSIINQPAGCYNISVEDDNGCTFTDIACINNPTGPTIVLDSIDSVLCYNQSNGAIFTTVTGPNIPLIISWQTVTSGSPTNLEDLENVNSGIYSITVTDNLDCISGSTFTVPEPDSIEVNANTTDLTCFENSSGEIDITISGGTGPFNISWTGPVGFVDPSTQDLSSLNQGSYELSGTDNNNCAIPNTIVTINEPSLLEISTQITNTACDQPTGTITISGSGGSVDVDYSYELQDISGNTISTNSLTENLDQGQYICFAYDDSLCVAFDTVSLNQAASPNISLNQIDDVDCAGNSTGSIYITVTGTASPFEYQWSGSVAPDPAHQTIEDFENWFAGTYQVVVTDTNGCSTTLDNLIIEQPITLFATENIINPLCSDGNTGSITLNPSGGTSPYLYEWSNNGIIIGNSITINNLDSGAYSYIITDSNNCVYPNTVNLTPPNSLVLNGNATPSSCGNANGSTDVSVTGGTVGLAGYNYSWYNAINGNSIVGAGNTLINLNSGIYKVVVSDDNSCSDSTNITVSDSDGPSISYTTSNIACFGVSNGNIDLTITGNGPPYNFIWTGPVGFIDPGSEDLSGLSPGDYSVFVTDPFNCSGAENITVGGPDDDIQIESTVTNLTCNNDSSGAISINIIGGTSPYNINWSGPNGFTSTDEDLVNLNDIGDYTISVTDALGCPDTGPLTEIYNIDQPTPLLIDTSILQPTCDSTDGLLYVTVSGGTPGDGYSYIWDDISTPEYNKSFTDTLADVGAGNYKITVSDSLGCSDSVVIAISDLNGPILTANTTDVDCVGDDDGTIDLTISPIGSYSIDWDNDGTGDADDNEDLVLLSAGSYSVVVEDLTTGCKSSLSRDINIANSLNLSLSPTTLDCNNDTTGTIVTSVIGGTPSYAFDWKLNGFTVSSEQNPINLPAGYYILTLTDSNGCQKVDSAEITQPSPINLTTGSVNSSCGNADGTVGVIANGGTAPAGYSYSWADIGGGYPGIVIGSTDTVNNLLSGSYQVTVTDENLCVDSMTVAISDDNAPTVSWNVTDVECFGDSTGVIDLTVAGVSPFTYSWTGPNGFTNNVSDSIGNLISGTYTVVVTDFNLCTRTKNIDVNGPLDGLSIDSNVIDLTCNGDSTGAISVQINGGTAPFQTIWNGPSGFSSTSEDLIGLDTGTYYLNITDDEGCQLINNIFNVSQPDSISIAETIVLPTCNALDGSISIVANGGTAATNYQYSWDNLTAPAFGIGILTSLSNIGAGNYQVTVTDDENCTGSKVFSIPNANAPTLTAEVTQIDCNGNSNGAIDLTITGTSSYTIDWDNDGVGDADDSEDLSGLIDGTYSVTVNDLSTGCVSVLSEVIIDPDPISIGSTVNNILCNGDNNGSVDIFLAGGSGTLTPIWTTIIPGNGIINSDTSQSGLSKGTYKIIVSDTNNCSDSATYIIEEADTISISNVLTDVQCSDSINGAISVTANGGTGTLIPTWASSNLLFSDPGTFNISSLDSGSYSLTITDSNSCNYDTTFNLNKPSEILALANITQVSCFDLANGEIELNVSGGNGGFITSWTGPNAFSSVEDSIFGLDTGAYSLGIIDGKGCVKDTIINITQPDKISLSAVINDVACYEDLNGKITVSVSGGSNPYSYDWAIDGTLDFDDDDSLFDLIAGAYPFSVLDSNNCQSDSTFIVEQPDEITLAATVSNNLCSYDSLGSISTTTNGGTGTINYSWTTLSGFSSIDVNLNALHNDTFNLLLTDSALCLLDTFFVISSNSAISANISINDANCGLSDGNASAIPIGGAGGTYNYSWKDINGFVVSTSNSLTGVASGTYSVTILDSNNCSVDTSFDILNTSGPSISANTTDPTCFGLNDGLIDVIISGGNQPYNVFWNPNNYSQGTTLTNVGAGNHIVSVIDAVGCETSDTITINNPPQVIIDLAITNSNCGVCTGNVIANPSGGNGSLFNTIWSNGDSGNLVSGLCAGVYSVSVSDDNGCTVSEDFSVSDDTSNISETITIVYPTCFGDNDGQITVSASGSNGPFNFLWLNNGSNSNTLTNITAGNYNLMITDNNGCSKIIDTLINSVNGEINVDAFITPASCGLNDGSITLSPIGGSGSYGYVWDNGTLNNNISNLANGNYGIVVTDLINGCITEKTYAVSSLNDSLNVVLNKSNISCLGINNGSISASLSGVNGLISEFWTDIGGNVIGNSGIISNLSSGVYFYNATEVNTGCQLFSSATIEDGDNIFVSLPNIVNASCDVSCDGEATIVAAGGSLPYSYLWSSGSTTSSVNNLCFGNQTVTITDNNGCILQQNLFVGENNDLSSVSNITDATCGVCDGEAIISSSGGSGNLAISWYDGSIAPIHSNLCAGVYGFNIIDNVTGCKKPSSINISNIGGPSNQIVNSVSPTCFGLTDGSASVAASGGAPPYEYLWIPGGQTTPAISNISSGNYSLEIIDDNGCLLVVPVLVSDPPEIQIEAIVSDASCGNSNGSISVIAYQGNGSLNYSWTGPNNFASSSSSIDGLDAGQYVVTITDANGCSITEYYNVNNINSLSLDLNTTDISCYNGADGSINSVVSGGNGSYSYLWTNNQTSADLTGVSFGFYGLTVTEISSGCVASSYVNLINPDSISLSIPIINEPSCYGDNDGQANIIPTGGSNQFTAIWTQSGLAGFSQINLSAGSYDVLVTDQNNCTTIQTVIINQPDSININIDQVIDAYCLDQNDGEIYVTVSGGVGNYIYSWIDSSGTFSSSNQDIDSLYPGYYYLTVNDLNGCYNYDSITISATNTVLAIAGTDTSVCIGNCLDIFGSVSGANNVTYQWNILDSSNIISSDSSILGYCFNDTNNITFELTVTDQNCSNSDLITVFVNDLPIVDAGEDTSEIFGSILNLGGFNTGPIGSSYIWSPTINFISDLDSIIANPSVEVLNDIIYIVTVTDSNGCINSDDIEVKLIPEISTPSGFSPNGDGKNDEWEIGNIDQFPECEVEIYSRWGLLLFKSPPGYTEKWKGEYNNKGLPVGTYYYIIELNDPKFKDPITGPITIIR